MDLKMRASSNIFKVKIKPCNKFPLYGIPRDVTILSDLCNRVETGSVPLTRIAI